VASAVADLGRDDLSAPMISEFLELEAGQQLLEARPGGIVLAAVGRLGEKVARGLADCLRSRGLSVAAVDVNADPEDLIDDQRWDVAAVVSPYKRATVASCDRLGSRARQTQVVDTLIRRAGEVVGFNVNSFAIQTACARWARVSPPRIAVIGTGATARSAVVGLAAVWPEADIAVVGRNPSQSASLIQDVGMGRVVVDADRFLPALVVHTTTVGECDDRQTLEVPLTLSSDMAVLDLNSRVTALQRDALAAGCLTMGGTYAQTLTNLMRCALVSQAR
jgi:shikimate dehydrogenase